MRVLCFIVVMAVGFIFPVGNAPPAVAAESCQQLVEQFNDAINAGHDNDAQRIVDAIATTSLCGRYQVAAQRRLSAFRLSEVNSMMARGVPIDDYENLLTAADRPQVLWQAAATVGEVRFGQRKFADAALAFDRAIEIVKNELLTPISPSKFDIETLFQRGMRARLLLANSANSIVETSRNTRDGMLGGIYSPLVRGIVIHQVVAPVTFEYAKTTFTKVGEIAARELLSAMREQMPAHVTLIGHTDIRGSTETNTKLSHDRADAVAAFLRENGINASFETVGKGATEPVSVPDTYGLSEEEIYALNRRVEWRRE
jgi:outer membrane protein OmpA-like peptidoglycan-associated protein